MFKSTQLFRGIPNKREYLARALGRLGALKLLERVVAARRPALVVLTYHRIAEPETDSFYDPVVSATPKLFRTQVKWLRDHMRILAARGAGRSDSLRRTRQRTDRVFNLRRRISR